MKNVKYGKCVRCGKTYEARPDLTSCTCGGILDIVYDYDYIRSVLTKEKLARRENRSMWRYRELLPVEETTPDTPLRVGWSPLYEEPNLARLLGDFMYDIHAWYPSFKRCEPSRLEHGARIIMENQLYCIAVEDNEWSLAVKLLQKGDGELEGLQRGWFDKYMFAIRKSLLKYLPDIGTYTGPWTSGRITKEEFAREVIERREKKHVS